MSIIVKEVEFHHYQELIQQIRTEVFVVEQSVPKALEYDDRDPLCHHVLAFEGDEAVATGRIDIERNGTIGRVSVLMALRGVGVGELIMQALHRIARRAGLTQVKLSAQVSALGFYQTLGYHSQGDLFVEAGIPHQMMQRGIEPVNNSV